MKKNQGAAVALVVCFVALIAVVGVTIFNRYEERTKTEQAKAEEEAKEKAEDRLKEDKQNLQEEETQTTDTQNIQAEIPKVDDPVSETPIVNSTTTAKPKELTFSETDTLTWPVDGNVILNYSMDQTIYFATLDQYKYNPALIISGEAGEPVLAAADGKVTAIKADAQTGNTLVVDIGSGYYAVYGQLQEIRVKEGERIEQGDVIGYVSEPTKYYSVEGPNLYFQILKDDESVNPLDYLEE